MNTGNITIIEAKSRFKKVDISLIENPNIDCLTLGIYTKLIVLGKKWELNVNGLRKHLGLSDEKVRKSLSLLEKEGYIVRSPSRNEKGQMMGWNYAIYPTPINENERSQAGCKSETSQGEEPTPRKTDHSDIGGLLNNRLNQSLDLIEIDKKESKDESLPKKTQTWRDDFDLFVSEVHKAKDVLLQDKSFRVKQERYYPNLDYELSLHKMVEDYWGTEEAWKKRKRQKKNQEGIDMVATLKKGFSQSFNRVYKQTNRGTKQQADLFNSYSPHKVSERANDYLRTLKVGVAFEKDGVTYLKDDTFIQEGKRYYRNKFGLLIEVPIGIVARPNEKWEYSKKTMVWVQDEQTITVDDYMF